MTRPALFDPADAPDFDELRRGWCLRSNRTRLLGCRGHGWFAFRCADGGILRAGLLCADGVLLWKLVGLCRLHGRFDGVMFNSLLDRWGGLWLR